MNPTTFRSFWTDVVGSSSSAAAAAPAAANQTPKPWSELSPSCDKYLTDHHFKAVMGEEIVPGDMVCEMWLDDHLVELRAAEGRGQANVRAALVAAIPEVQFYPIDLGHLVADRWDLEVRQTLVLSGKMPAQKPVIQPAPDEVLRRKTDGQIYWTPNPAVATMAGVGPPADKDWIEGFLDFYDFGPPADLPDPQEKKCTFNSAATTIDDVISQADTQATLAGYKLDRGGAQQIAKRIYQTRSQAQQKGKDLAQRVGSTNELTLDVTEFGSMKMPLLLDALEKVRAAGQLDKLKGLLPLNPSGQRVNAAILAVKHLGDQSLDGPFRQNLALLNDEDRAAINHYLYGRIVSGDLGYDPNATPGSSTGDGSTTAGADVTLSFAYAVIPRTDHVSLDPDPSHGKPRGDPSHDKPGQQLSYTVNVQIKRVTVAFTCQLTVFRDSDGRQKYAVQSIWFGPQFTVDSTPKFLEGILEVDVIATALIGQTRQEVRGEMKLVPSAQVAVGTQILHKFKLPGTKMKLVLGVQVAGSVTDPRGAPRTADATSQGMIGVEW